MFDKFTWWSWINQCQPKFELLSIGRPHSSLTLTGWNLPANYHEIYYAWAFQLFFTSGVDCVVRVLVSNTTGQSHCVVLGSTHPGWCWWSEVGGGRQSLSRTGLCVLSWTLSQLASVGLSGSGSGPPATTTDNCVLFWLRLVSGVWSIINYSIALLYTLYRIL